MMASEAASLTPANWLKSRVSKRNEAVSAA